MLAQVIRRIAVTVSAVGALAVVCPAQFFSPAPEQAAKVISLTGQVSVLHDSQPWALNVGDSVQVKQIIITGPDGYAQFQVADGSTFEVYPNSNLVFRKNPGNWHDLLDVLVGRVKIHIQKLGGQPNPNRITTPTAVISVRGTTFDVSVDGDDDSTVVSVDEGEVSVRHALKGDERRLGPGESITVYRNAPLAHSLIDKGALAQRILHSLTDAVYTAARTGAAKGSSGGLNTDQKAPPAPPAPAPVPAPPPAPPAIH